MNKKVLILLSSATVLMTGCLEDEVVNATDEAKTNSTITMKIVDSKSGLPIDSAVVYSELDQDTLYSDSMGIVSWAKNAIGDYRYIVSKEGYAHQIANISVEESGKGNTARVADKILQVDLHKEGVTVNGTVLLKDTKTDNLTAASKIPVVIKYVNGEVYPSEIKTTTDASGVFSFKNLAENCDYQIIVPQAEIDGQTYEARNAEELVVGGLRAGEVRSMNQITMEVVGLLPELIRTNFATLDTIDEDADIFLTFSTDLVEDSVENAWSVYKGGIANVEVGRCEGGAQVLVASGLDRDGKTVMINSISNKWNRTTYCLEGSVYTKEGRSKKLAVNFTPGSLSGRPSNVTKITFDDTENKLSWTVYKNEIAGLSGYKIFYRTDRMADALEYRDITDNKTTEININLYDTRFEDATRVYFYVLPYAEINGKIVTSDVGDEDLLTKKVDLVTGDE
ncbi:MAG: hypothetical protein IK114_01770 [Fibrobacter sp.]|nr:hypothetical protein [Fibrobacter sp.]